nr:hypothetical protein [Bacteroidia bacterium]
PEPVYALVWAKISCEKKKVNKDKVIKPTQILIWPFRKYISSDKFLTISAQVWYFLKILSNMTLGYLNSSIFI